MSVAGDTCMSRPRAAATAHFSLQCPGEFVPRSTQHHGRSRSCVGTQLSVGWATVVVAAAPDEFLSHFWLQTELRHYEQLRSEAAEPISAG